MKNKKKELKGVKFKIIYFLVFLFVFGVIFYRIGELSLSEKVDGINIQEFANNRITRKEVLPSKRGTIYDVNGNALAENVSSYTLIAYLSPSRTTNPAKPEHVVDIDYTADELSKVLDLPKEKIIGYLSRKAYQVEFGSKGRGLSELKKDEILSLNLPGIDFIETQKRYYPYGNFLSYTLGYAVEKNLTDEDGNEKKKIIGEMGIESYYDKELSGSDGYTLYQKDRNGYKIAGTKEITVDAVDGYDVYLTIDSNIQLFVEEAASKMLSQFSVDFISIMVADAKTGSILASYSSPSFDPNKRDITSYLDKNIATGFEPGSTMKIFSYMGAMETGKYNGEELYKSGIYVARDGTEIGDWKREGWGYITYDQGFARSSNTAVMNLTTKYMNATYLKNYYQKLGFGSKTGIDLPNETAGKLNFRYETEVLNASFGQGILTTPIQNVKALTSIANDGILLKPYIIHKIVDPNTGKVVVQNEKTELGRVASKETTDKIRELMRSVITGENGLSTGSYYYMDGYDFIAKTGTAQVAKENGAGYGNVTIKGLAGMFPGDDPQIIIYMAIKNPPESNNPSRDIIQSIIKNVSKYKNIYVESFSGAVKLDEISLQSFVNKDVTSSKNTLNSYGIEVVTLGSGQVVIDQYPVKGTMINKIDKVFFLTEGEIKMPNLWNYSMKDFLSFASLTGISYEIKGSGYLNNQSIPEGTPLDDKSHLLAEFSYKM